MKFKLTNKEKLVIKKLKTLAKVWPKSLWLFSANGELCVMRKDRNGNIPMTKSGGVDQEYKVDVIKIKNDGGDW